MITITSKGSFANTDRFLRRASSSEITSILSRFGVLGVNALAAATPVDSGATASAWFYEIKRSRNSFSIVWGNTNVVSGQPIAVLLQYGHGTGTGGYVQGRDYINPAIQPIFDQIAEEAWKAVTS